MHVDVVVALAQVGYDAVETQQYNTKYQGRAADVSQHGLLFWCMDHYNLVRCVLRQAATGFRYDCCSCAMHVMMMMMMMMVGWKLELEIIMDESIVPIVVCVVQKLCMGNCD